MLGASENAVCLLLPASSIGCVKDSPRPRALSVCPNVVTAGREGGAHATTDAPLSCIDLPSQVLQTPHLDSPLTIQAALHFRCVPKAIRTLSLFHTLTCTHTRTAQHCLFQTVHFKVHDPKMHSKGGTSRENTVGRYHHGHGGGSGSMGRRGRYDEESGGGSGRTDYGHGSSRNHNHHPPPMMMTQVRVHPRSESSPAC